MTVSLAANALTLLATAKEDLGIAVSTYDDQLTRLINSASAFAAKYCSRVFERNTAIVEKAAGYGEQSIRLARTPVNELISVTLDGSTVDEDDYEIADAQAGVLHQDGGWEWTAHSRPDISQGYVPGTERKLFEITYDGGWVTPNQSAAMTGTPSLAFAATTPATITRASGSWITDGFAANLPITISGSTSNDGEYRIASVTALVVTLASDETLTAEGPTASCVATITRTLPWDLEDAVIDLVRSYYAAKRRDPGVTSESLMSWSASTNIILQGGPLPMMISRVLNQYKRYDR